MPTIDQNRDRWTSFAWEARGDEWSEGWGGSERLWHHTIWPRLGAFLPAATILEIAPGHGRVTSYLLAQCDRLHVVDLVPECIEGCRARFAGHGHVEYHVNDGTSLSMLGDASVDVAVSWDSLVHAERDVIASYLKELGRVLRPGGTAFLHHANLGAYRHRFSGKLTVRNPHWRAESVSARLVRKDASSAGLRVLAQELIPWGGTVLNDCFSLLRRPEPGEARRAPIVVSNHAFGHEVAHARTVAALYRAEPGLLEEPREGRALDGHQPVRWGDPG